jgi:hypothetical protein
MLKVLVKLEKLSVLGRIYFKHLLSVPEPVLQELDQIKETTLMVALTMAVGSVRTN